MTEGVKQPCEAFTICEADSTLSFKTGVKREACEANSSKDRYIAKLLILHRRKIRVAVKNGVISELSLPASRASHTAKIQQPVGEPFASQPWTRVLHFKQDETKNTKAAKNTLNYCHIYNNSFFNALDYDKYTGETRAHSLEEAA